MLKPVDGPGQNYGTYTHVCDGVCRARDHGRASRRHGEGTGNASPTAAWLPTVGSGGGSDRELPLGKRKGVEMEGVVKEGLLNGGICCDDIGHTPRRCGLG